MPGRKLSTVPVMGPTASRIIVISQQIILRGTALDLAVFAQPVLRDAIQLSSASVAARFAPAVKQMQLTDRTTSVFWQRK